MTADQEGSVREPYTKEPIPLRHRKKFDGRKEETHQRKSIISQHPRQEGGTRCPPVTLSLAGVEKVLMIEHRGNEGAYGS